MKQQIVRKDGINYERKSKTRNYDSVINIRISKETVNSLKKIAEHLGVKYNTMVREILEDYVEREK
jgi:predicted DNA binding CopG/RHH family protein